MTIVLRVISCSPAQHFRRLLCFGVYGCCKDVAFDLETLFCQRSDLCANEGRDRGACDSASHRVPLRDHPSGRHTRGASSSLSRCTQIYFSGFCSLWSASQDVSLAPRRWYHVLYTPLSVRLLLSLLPPRDLRNRSCQGNIRCSYHSQSVSQSTSQLRPRGSPYWSSVENSTPLHACTAVQCQRLLGLSQFGISFLKLTILPYTHEC